MRGNFLRKMIIAKDRFAVTERAMQSMQPDRPKSPVQASFRRDISRVNGNNYPKKSDKKSAIYTDTF